MQPAARPERPWRDVLDRVFEWSSVAPLGAFVLLHLADYARVLFGADEIGARRAPPLGLLCLEALLVWLPLAFHAGFGVSVWLRRRRLEARASPDRALLALHRLTGALAGLFLVEHFVRFRLPVLRGAAHPSDAVQQLVSELSSTRAGVPVLAAFELFGMLAVAYHLGYGLLRCAARWPWAQGRRAVRAACVGTGLLAAAAGALTLVRLAAG